MAAGTFMVAGERVRTSSNSRYVAWMVCRRFDGVRYTDEISSRSIFARSSKVSTIQARIRRYGWSAGCRFVIIDTFDGSEIVNF